MKYLLLLLLLAMLVFGLWPRPGHQPHNDAPVTGLPWQIDHTPDGHTRVFGISPGVTTLGEAIDRLGRDMELAIIAAPGKTGVLEAYYSHYSAGPITGSLILVADAPAADLETWRGHAFHEPGTRRYRLASEDRPHALQAPVRVITFSPAYKLDEEAVRNRFGPPVSVVQVSAQERHLLYPERGLDLVLNTEGKDVLQYLAPSAFDAWRATLQAGVPARN